MYPYVYWSCLYVYEEKSIIITVTAYNTASMELLSVIKFFYKAYVRTTKRAMQASASIYTCEILFERAQALSKYAENKRTKRIIYTI